MEPYQFWVMLASIASLLISFFTWIITWIRAIDRKVSDIEIRMAILETRIEERK